MPAPRRPSILPTHWGHHPEFFCPLVLNYAVWRQCFATTHQNVHCQLSTTLKACFFLFFLPWVWLFGYTGGREWFVWVFTRVIHKAQTLSLLSSPMSLSLSGRIMVLALFKGGYCHHTNGLVGYCLGQACRWAGYPMSNGLSVCPRHSVQQKNVFCLFFHARLHSALPVPTPCHWEVPS